VLRGKTVVLSATFALAAAIVFTAAFELCGLGRKSNVLFYLYSPPLLFAACVSGNIHNISVPAYLAGILVETFLLVFVVGNAMLTIWRRLRFGHGPPSN